MESPHVLFPYLGNLTALVRSRLSRAAVFTTATLSGVLVSTAGHPRLDVLLLAPLATFFVSLSMYLLNDIFDFEVDKINAPTRPIPSNRVSREEALVFVAMLDVIGLGIAAQFGWAPLGILGVATLIGICYSIRPFNLKDKFIVKTLSIGAGGIAVSIFGGAVSGEITPTLIFCAAMFLVFLFATSPLNDLADYAGDKTEQRRTIPIVIGPQRTIELSIVASITPLIGAVVLFPLLRLSYLSIVLLTLLSARALQLLIPLLSHGTDAGFVRKNHKQMVVLHFVLQGALACGALIL
jgi:geranylgeranylglycerol-phosphate geranylgeranyltransferase